MKIIQKEIEKLKLETEALRNEYEKSKIEIQARAKEQDEKSAKDFEETRQILKEVSRQLGGIGNSNGAYAEEIFFSSLAKQKRLGGIK